MLAVGVLFARKRELDWQQLPIVLLFFFFFFEAVRTLVEEGVDKEGIDVENCPKLDKSNMILLHGSSVHVCNW